MKTFGGIVEELLSDVRGFTAASDVVTSLAADMTSSDTTGQVADLSVVSTGVIEVGDELMWVRAIDSQSGTFTLLPKGRGWSGTTAAAHLKDDTVTISPAFPRSRLKTAVNDAIQELWPVIFPLTTTEFTWNNTIKVGWEVPAEAEQIMAVRYRDYLGNWQKIRAWELERSADVTDFPSGVALRITQTLPPGCKVQVVYGKKPAALVNETDAFTVTGFEDRISDLVILNVKARLLPMLDVHRLQVTHVPADELDQPRPIGSADAIAKSFRQQYQLRLQQEQRVLNKRYPAPVHITR